MTNRFQAGSFTGDSFAQMAPLDCSALAQRLGSDPSAETLLALCRARNQGEDLSIWDLPRITGQALPEVFATVRALEIARYVRVEDNPSDPFGARVAIAEEGIRYLQARAA